MSRNHIDKYQDLPVFHFSKMLQTRHNKKNIKCIIFGNFGTGDPGDEAILAGQIAELRKNPDIAITVAGKNPEEIRRLHHVNAVSLYKFSSVRRVVKKSDFVIVGGGGLISTVPGKIFRFYYQLYLLFVFYILPRIYKKKLYIFGIEIFDNTNALILKLALPFVRNAAIITVRDFDSFAFFKEKQMHAGLYKDNSYLMNPLSVKDLLQDGFVKKEYRSERWQIGLSLKKPNSRSDEKRLIKELAGFLSLHANRTDFWYFFQQAPDQYRTEEVLMKKILADTAKKTNEPVTIHALPKSVSPLVYYSLMKLMHGFISMHFHSALFAYRLKIPFISISGDKTSDNFMYTIGKDPVRIKSLHESVLTKEFYK